MSWEKTNYLSNFFCNYGKKNILLNLIVECKITQYNMTEVDVKMSNKMMSKTEGLTLML